MKKSIILFALLLILQAIGISFNVGWLHIFSEHTSSNGAKVASYPNLIPVIISILLTILLAKLFNINKW